MVHVLGGAWVSVAGVAAARVLGLPVVVTPFVHPGYWRDDPASLRSYRRADAVLATLESDAADLERLGVPRELISVCGLPVPGVSGHHVKDGDPLAVFVGARVPHKGVDLLRGAARLVWERVPEARFAYVGPGPRLEDPDPRELDVGALPDEARDEWLARATVLCLPSASESFGLVVAEAWSAHTPVVTSDIPVLKELVEAARGGLAVPREAQALADALSTLLADRGEAERLGEAGYRHWDAQYRPERVAVRHVAVYSALLEASRHPSRR